MSEQDPFEARVSRLVNYLTRAHKHNKPSILFALYLSEFLRIDVESSLDTSLKEQGIEIVAVDAGENKDIPAFISSINSKDTVFLVYNLEKGFPEALKFLNFKREELIDNKVKVVFWVKEEELARITLEAPDFFAFRNRVVEFMEPVIAEGRRPALVDFALETEYKSLDEIERSIELKKKLLSELSGDDEISGYLFHSLGTLYYYISGYNKSIKYLKKALYIKHKIGDIVNEGNIFGNLGNAYVDMGEVDKAIEYYEKALFIAKETGNRSNEGCSLGNLGSAYKDLGQVDKAFEYYKQALIIAKEMGDRLYEGNTLINLGNAYRNLGQVDKAIEYYGKALIIAKETGNKRNEGSIFGNFGNAYIDMGQVDKAIEYYKRAFTLEKEIGDKKGEERSLYNLGLAFESETKYREALACYLMSKNVGGEIITPYIIKTEYMKEKLGEKEFEKLEAEVTPKAKEIVNQILESNLY